VWPMQTPDDLRYSPDHEWIRIEGGNRARLGITDYAQDALGDVVFIDLPALGTTVAGGQVISEVESTKSVSEIYSPVAGEIVEVNTDLVDAPDKLNSDPYGEGWICVIELGSVFNPSDFMDASGYIEMTEA
jgi:glycine cleavage system H protein